MTILAHLKAYAYSPETRATRARRAAPPPDPDADADSDREKDSDAEWLADSGHGTVTTSRKGKSKEKGKGKRKRTLSESPAPAPSPTPRRTRSSYFAGGSAATAIPVDATSPIDLCSSDEDVPRPPPRRAQPGSLSTPRPQTSGTRRRRQPPAASSSSSLSPAPPPRRPDGSLQRYGWTRAVYAHPETGPYAHIGGVPDHLQRDLDVVFIGINPGTRSGERGHFFAHPTNKFWRALFAGGFTERLLAPEEDSTLLTRGVGLTNLVDRVTKQAAELSTREQRLAVGRLSRKLAVHAPRVACFVGKGIWDVWVSVAKRSVLAARQPRRRAPPPPATPRRVVQYTLENGVVTPSRAEEEVDELDDDVKPAVDEALVAIDGAAAAAAPAPPPAPPVPLPTRPPGDVPQLPPAAAITYEAPQRYRLVGAGGHTYLWVVPSTSGLEHTPLAAHEEYFYALREFANALAFGDEAEGEFVDVYVDELDEIVAKLQAEGERRRG